MKFYSSQVNVVYDKIAKGQINSILLYGPDKGYISNICQTIVKDLNLIVTSLPYSNITASSLNLLLNSTNFFNKREFIKITEVKTTISSEIQKLLLEPFNNFIAFIADELPSGCTIRSFFETKPSLASIACYNDDEQGIIKIIKKKCTSANKIIEKDALVYLTSSLKGDFQLINNELDKLISYVCDKNTITLEDVTLVIVNDLIASGDDLCIFFAEKDIDKMLHELEKLQTQGINIVLVIRAVIRYYLNLYIVLSKMQEGCSIDSAIGTLSPPVFFKKVPSFKKIANSIRINDVVNVLHKLQQAEVKFKLEPKGFDFLMMLQGS